MTRLEWCRKNAPDTYSNYSDEELLLAMLDTCKEYEDEFEPDEELYNTSKDETLRDIKTACSILLSNRSTMWHFK